MTRAHAVMAMLAMLVLSRAGAAEVYRWTDGNGQINYGETPPAGATHVRLVDVQQPTTVPALVSDADQKRAADYQSARRARLEEQLLEAQIAAENARAAALRQSAALASSEAAQRSDCSNASLAGDCADGALSIGPYLPYDPIVAGRAPRQPILGPTMPPPLRPVSVPLHVPASTGSSGVRSAAGTVP